jgi:ubiquinone/menaquinone biosynthesis C-methylase UbiE
MLLKDERSVASARPAPRPHGGEGGRGLPDYAPAFDALHRAFAVELDQAIGELPLHAGARVLDAPCGDGFFTACLARRLGPAGAVVAADHCPEYLAWAERRVGTSALFVLADSYRLPFADGTFDLVWCSQSLISLEAVPALLEIRRVLRPGGFAAVMENDDFHHVLLPWPVELELAVQRAFYLACRERYGNASKLYQSRRLAHTLRRAGLVPRRRTTHAIDREAPLDPADRAFFRHFFAYLSELALGHLEPEDAHTFKALTDPGSDRCLLDRPDFEATYLFTVAIGTRPD